MNEKYEIRSEEMASRIRDDMAYTLEGKSHAEIIAFFRRVGDVARQEAKRQGKIEPQTESRG